MHEDEHTLDGKKMPKDGTVHYMIDGWLILEDRNQLKKGHKTVKLQFKFMQVLLLLITENGNTVSKDQLHQQVWSGVTITDHSINQAISRLRKVFGDSAQNPRIIETIPKVGYRLICSVERVDRSGQPLTADRADLFAPDIEVTQDRIPARPASIMDGLLPWLLLGGILSFVVLVVITLISGFPRFGNSMINVSGIVPLTTSLGFERDISFSADDRHFLYAHNQPPSRQYDIFLQSPQMAAQNLTNSDASERSPRFSPDARRVIYSVISEDSLAIHLLDLDSDSVRELYGRPRLQEVNDLIKGLDWSDDGLMLVFSMKEGPGFASALYLMSLTTGNTRKLTEPGEDVVWDRFPAFSPDGQQVAFARMTRFGEEDLYTCRLDGGGLTRLTHENGEIAGIDWPSANPAEIIFCRNTYGVHYLKSVNMARETRLLLPPFQVNPGGINPCLSASGKFIAFEKWLLCANVYRMDLENSLQVTKAPQRLIASSYSDWNARLSPNGKLIAFLSNRSGEDRMWLTNADGTFARQASEHNVLHNTLPVWSPDSRSVLYTAYQNDSYHIYRCDVNRPHTDRFIANAQAPNFSADGSRVYFASTRQGEWQLWQYVFASGDTSQVTQNAGFFAQETPSGDSLFFTKLVQPGIWKLKENGSEELIVADASTQEIQNWAVGTNGIYYIKMGIQQLPKLIFFSFADKSETEILLPELSFPHLMNGLCLSADGKTLLFSLLEHAEVDIVKVPFGQTLQ